MFDGLAHCTPRLSEGVEVALVVVQRLLAAVLDDVRADDVQEAGVVGDNHQARLRQALPGAWPWEG